MLAALMTLPSSGIDVSGPRMLEVSTVRVGRAFVRAVMSAPAAGVVSSSPRGLSIDTRVAAGSEQGSWISLSAPTAPTTIAAPDTELTRSATGEPARFSRIPLSSMRARSGDS